MSKEKLTTYEKVKAIRNSLLTRVGESLAYNREWSDKFKLSNVQDIHKTLEVWEKDHGSFKINPTELTIEQMTDLGFGYWGEDNPMKLIPIWLFPFLCDEFESESISGNKANKLSDMDSDHRGGLIAYGVVSKL